MEIHTLVDLFHASVEERPRPAMFRTKLAGEWIATSSEDFTTAVAEVATGLLVLGAQPGDRFGLLSENREEWALADLAILSVGGVVVPIYPTLLPEQIEFILSDCEPVGLFCSDESQVAKLDDTLDRLPFLQNIVSFERADRAEAILLDKLRELGRVNRDAKREELEERRRQLDAGQTATIIYTSGTTGRPKGVMLTHHNIVHNVENSLKQFDIDQVDDCLSFLPLSHILERMAGYYLMLRKGVCIAYAESVETVAANMTEVHPTVMISVPRLYEKIYSRVLDAASQGSPMKRKIFYWAKAVGTRWTNCKVDGRSVPPLLALQHKIADALVFKKLRARTGGNLRFFVSGGAPLAKEIAEFFYSAGLPVLEGYGLTETSPVIAVNTFEHFKPGSVGPPIPGVDVKIADDGEILTRSEAVMAGYWNRPEDTAETIVDGWLHTGDIGHIDEKGFLFITDRKKDLIVTAGGKNIAPQPVENELKLSTFIAEAVLIGDRRRYLTALLVPNFEALDGWAEAKEIESQDRRALVDHPDTQRLFAEVVHAVNGRLAAFEQIKYFRMVDHEFTLEDGQLTPSLKVKRKVVTERYTPIIDEMYGEG